MSKKTSNQPDSLKPSPGSEVRRSRQDPRGVERSSNTDLEKTLSIVDKALKMLMGVVAPFLASLYLIVQGLLSKLQIILLVSASLLIAVSTVMRLFPQIIESTSLRAKSETVSRIFWLGTLGVVFLVGLLVAPELLAKDNRDGFAYLPTPAPTSTPVITPSVVITVTPTPTATPNPVVDLTRLFPLNAKNWNSVVALPKDLDLPGSILSSALSRSGVLASATSEGVFFSNVRESFETGKHNSIPERIADISAIAFSPPGDLAAIAQSQYSHDVVLYDTYAHERRGFLPHRERVNNLAFKYDGSKIATATDTKLTLFNICRGFGGDEQELPITPTAQIVSLAFNTENLLAAGLESGQIRVFQVDENPPYQETRILSDAFSSAITTLAFNPNSIRKDYLAAGSSKSIKIWDITKPSLSPSGVNLDSDVRSLSFSSDGEMLVIGTAGGEVKVVDLNGQQLASLRLSGSGGIVLAAFVFSQRMLIAVAQSGQVHAWGIYNNNP
jgi:hypothetical protein